MVDNNNEEELKKKKIKAGIIYALIMAGLIFLVYSLFNARYTKDESYSDFKKQVADGEVSAVSINLSTSALTYYLKTDESIAHVTYPTEDFSLVTAYLEQYSVPKYTGEVKSSSYIGILLLELAMTFGLGLLFWRFISKRLKDGGMGDALSFGKNNAKIYAENETGIKFSDVAGEDEAKESLEEIVDLLHNPQKYTAIGAKMPKGALLVGPPGTGKTMLAKAVAGEAKVPFFSMSGSEFVQMFVGMGAARVRDLFKQAQEKAPCIIFIDEIDAIGKTREGSMYSNDEREQTLNQLLTEMDGFDSSKGVVILGATNRPEVLDPALLRPGRFDRRINVETPDLPGRLAILEVHAKKVRMSDKVDLNAIAKTTPGASGADLANIINEGALLAVRKGRDRVEQWDLEEALDVVIAGKIKKDRVLSAKEKQAVAYHELGHAFLAHLLPNADEVQKITIIPRTKGALGYTMQAPGEEHYLVTREEMEDQIAVSLAGRAAEEVLLGQVSTGAANDIEKATETARRMVTVYGMTERFDMVGLENPSMQYLDGDYKKNYSASTGKEIDDEILSIIKKQHQRALRIIMENKEAIMEAASYLMSKETITGDEFLTILKENGID